MSDFKTISRDLIDHLKLRYEPVGVTLYLDADPLPQKVPLTQENFKSYCQALVLAGEGQTLLLRGERMGCKLGTSVLGFEKEPEAYLDDGVLEKYGVGLFGSEEASAATIRQSFFLAKGGTQAALIAPLASFTASPQVVVFRGQRAGHVAVVCFKLREGRQDGPAPIGRSLGGLRRHYRPAFAPGEAQRHLSGPGLPPESGPGPLPPDAGNPRQHPGAASHPHPGHGQTHSHADKSALRG